MNTKWVLLFCLTLGAITQAMTPGERTRRLDIWVDRSASATEVQDLKDNLTAVVYGMNPALTHFKKRVLEDFVAAYHEQRDDMRSLGIDSARIEEAFDDDVTSGDSFYLESGKVFSDRDVTETRRRLTLTCAARKVKREKHRCLRTGCLQLGINTAACLVVGAVNLVLWKLYPDGVKWGN